MELARKIMMVLLKDLDRVYQNFLRYVFMGMALILIGVVIMDEVILMEG